MKLYLAIFLIFCTNAVFSQSGDSTRTTTPEDSVKIPFDVNKIPGAYRLSNTSETIGISDWIWNDKRNLGEILNERPGYMVNFFDDGGRNVINFNRMDEKGIGIFKDGIQINDNLFGGFDIENISVNEIDTIEELSNISSFLWGYNTQAKSINIITKDVFQPELFSQLRFSQDRYGSEDADVYFSQSFSRKLNWQIGANKRSITGRYTNSDFDVWRARGKVNWLISPKANIRLNINYANIQRGLNGGLIYSTEDTLRSADDAQVVNSDAYEKLTNFYYDFSYTGRLFKNKNSLTKVRLYSQNSLREYRDEENRTNSNGIFISKNFHVIQYGLDVKQNLGFKISKDINTNLLIGGNMSLNIFDFDYPNPTLEGEINRFNANYYSAIGKLDTYYKNLVITLSGRYDNLYSQSFIQSGIETNYTFYKNNDISVSAFGGTSGQYGNITYLYLLWFNPDSSGVNPINTTSSRYTEAGIKFSSKYFYAKLYQYGKSAHDKVRLADGNYEAGLLTEYIDARAVVNYNEGSVEPNEPEFFVKGDISFHDLLFKDNLNLRVGINLKYLHNLLTQPYNQLYYDPYTFNSQPITDSTYIDNLFNMDFYVSARIGSANIAFTFANIFNNFNYNTYLYPWDDRGGAFNSLSRFTITWDFLN